VEKSGRKKCITERNGRRPENGKEENRIPQKSIVSEFGINKTKR
jgi:hypothetical protein